MEKQTEECVQAKIKAGMTEEEARAACAEQKSTKSEIIPNLTEQIAAVMKEYGKTLAEQIKTDIREEMDKVVAETKNEAVEAIRKGLGLAKDPVIHLSEIEGIVRKIVLEKAEPGKRTETATPDKPTEGEDITKTKLKSAEDLFKEQLAKKGTVF